MRKAARGLLGTLVFALSAVPFLAHAQSGYPSAPIKLSLGFPAGATADVVARLLAQTLSKQMNTPFVVDNRPGANANISAEFVASSKPDGYTLLLNSSGVVLSPALGEKLNYDPSKDLVPVSLVASTPSVLAVNPAVPANTVGEFIAYVKANPDKVAFGSAGVGNTTHLAALLFLQANGLTALHVPYKGGGAAMADLIAGRVQFTMQNPVTVVPMLKSQRVKALAITSLKRSALMPDVPTLNETVMPGFEMGSWYGIMVPAKTSPAIVKRLNDEVLKALQDSEVKTSMAREDMQPIGTSSEQYATYLKSELERWTKVIKTAGVKPE